MLTQTQYEEYRAARNSGEGHNTHPICVLLRQLRLAARLTLTDFEDQYGIPAVVLGAYERGDRLPPLPKLDAVLACYGYVLAAVPASADAIRHPPDMVADLRAIANQLEATNDVPTLPGTAAWTG